MTLTTIVVTSGEPAGIGPDLCVALAQTDRTYRLAVIADPLLLMQRASLLGLPLKIKEFEPNTLVRDQRGELQVIPETLLGPCEPGVLNPENSPYVLRLLQRAVKGCQSGEFAAMVTAPVHKGVINQAKIHFTGHTEFLAELTGAKQPVMMLASKKLKVALVTTHLPLKKVADAITAERLESVIDVLYSGLEQQFEISEPVILVCGLNPHSGEAGHLGREEIEVIEPMLDKMRKRNRRFLGPLPADTVFTRPYLRQADAVLAMYHDQGLPTLKALSFGDAVNITLGLPITRVSVDHGTALSLAGKGSASSSSLVAAIDYALSMKPPFHAS